MTENASPGCPQASTSTQPAPIQTCMCHMQRHTYHTELNIKINIKNKELLTVSGNKIKISRKGKPNH